MHVFIQAGVDFIAETNGADGSWSWEGISHTGDLVCLDNLPQTSLHIESVAAAVQATQLLNVQTDAIDYRCLADLALAGRYQKLTIAEKHVILDVAHNPAAASHLSKKLENDPCVGKTFALVAIMADKDAGGIVTPLASQIDIWYPIELGNIPRALSGRKLAETISKQGLRNV